MASPRGLSGSLGIDNEGTLMRENLSQRPDHLPLPIDEGGASHLEGAFLPDLNLASTDGASVNPARLKGQWVLYIYPMTGRPDIPLPEGWDAIPGARGCTPQACGFRDHYAELKQLNAGVFGLSTQQTTEYQREARDRLHLPFQLLSDSALLMKAALGLPTFRVAGMLLYKRLTLIAQDGQIRKLFYPVFPPDRNAHDVLAWLRAGA